MKKTRLFKLILVLSAHETRAFRKFLASPYFNKRADVVLLYELLLTLKEEEKEVTKVEIFPQIYTNTAYDDQKMRLVMSYLQKLLEEFLAIENIRANDVKLKREVTKNLRKRGATTLHIYALKDAEKRLQNLPLRHADYHYENYQLQLENYRINSKQKPDKDADFQQVSDSLDVAFFSIKLRQTCLLLAHQQVYQWDFQPNFIEEILTIIAAQNMQQIPAIGVYFYCYQMLVEPEKEANFQAFKSALLKHGALFPDEEVQDLYYLAINYGIRKVNQGQKHYFHDVMDFYKAGLEQEYLLENGILSRFTYHNVVGAALQIGEANWAISFIDNYKTHLEKRYRESSYSFNRARIAYSQKDFDTAMQLLQKSNYRDPLLNLGARTLLLKIYYEIDEFDALQSHLDAFRNYIRRQHILGYHKTNYLTIIKYARRLISVNIFDKTAIKELRQQIDNEAIMTEKVWFLAQLKHT